MTQQDSSGGVEDLPYARAQLAGIDPAVIARIIGYTGLIASISRLLVPVRLFFAGSMIFSGPLRFGPPGLGFFWNGIVLVCGSVSAIALLIVSIGVLRQQRAWIAWLWISEPAAMIYGVFSYGGMIINMLKQSPTLSADLFLYYILAMSGGFAIPVALLLMVSAVRKAARVRLS